MRRRSKEGVEWLEADLGGATACFTTRRGGYGAPPYESLNLGVLTGDDRDTVIRNRSLVAEALEIDGNRVRMGLQVHGSRILRHVDPSAEGHYLEPVVNPPEADGHTTRVPGLPLLVLAADCLPVALSGPGGLAMLHCGWRGLAGSLVQDAADVTEAGAAVIGPGIGPCCFEVGPDVKDAFSGLGEGIFDGRMCDLPEVARRVLGRAGVERVETAGICTFCDRDDFFSHRRDGGNTGRQAGIAWLN